MTERGKDTVRPPHIRVSIFTRGVYCKDHLWAPNKRTTRTETCLTSFCSFREEYGLGVELNLCWPIYAVDLVLPAVNTVMSMLA